MFLKHLARAYPDRGDGTELHLVMDNYATHKRPEGTLIEMRPAAAGARRVDLPPNANCRRANGARPRPKPT